MHELSELYDLLRSNGIEREGNPDLYVREYRTFGIDDARELRDRASTRALGLSVQGARSGARAGRVFIVVTPFMTTDAQNALLKTLEEPPGGALFFFIVPSPMTLLPTLRSRVQMLDIQPSRRRLDGVKASPRRREIDPKAFLGALPQARLDMLKPLFAKDENDERDSRPALMFLSELERTLATSSARTKDTNGFKAIYRARTYIGDKGSLMKPLLEQVALLTTRVI